MFNKFKLVCVTLGVSALTACAPSPGAHNQYYTSQAMQTSEVSYGTIVSGRHVEMRALKGNSDQFAGALLGGVAGAFAGDKFGNGRGNKIMTGLGAIGGAAAGSALAQSANRQLAQEWTVRLDNGRTVAIVYQDPSLAPGQRVQVIEGRGETKLVQVQ